MPTPYEYGKAAGKWTDEQIRECGFTSAEECLQYQEAIHQEDVAKLDRLYARNPAYAAQHAEYLEGVIAATRESLRDR